MCLVVVIEVLFLSVWHTVKGLYQKTPAVLLTALQRQNAVTICLVKTELTF